MLDRVTIRSRRWFRLVAVLLNAVVLLALSCSAVACGVTPSAHGPEPPPTSPQAEVAPGRQGQSQFPPPNLRFERITREDGLSSNTVTHILQDSQGFLWIGTQDGLNRFDGYSFVTYRYDPDDPSSLRDDFIESIYEDRDGELWVGTQSGWLEHYDRLTDRFTHYQISSHVYTIHKDREGMLWIGSKDPGLLRFDPDTGETETVWGGQDFTSIVEDRVGDLWVTSPQEGLGRYDRTHDRFTVFEPEYPVHAIVEDRSGVLWLATWGGGLARFDRDTERFDYLLPDPTDPYSIHDNSVSAVFEDTAGAMWLGFYGSGLDRFDPDGVSGQGRFAHYQHDPSDPHSLSTDSITAIFQDRSGTLWVGHEDGGGLSRLATGSDRFGHYRHVPDDPNSLGGDQVTSLFEDQQRDLWIGTFSGLDRWQRTTGQWRNYRHAPGDPGSLAHDSVRSVYVDQANVLWVGTEGGLDRYDRQEDRFVHIGSPVVMWMHEGPSGTMWLATKQGLFTLDRDAEELTLFTEGYSWKIMVFEDQSGVVWVGSSGDGLDRYDPASGEWRHYENDPDDPHSLSDNSVETIHEDQTGALWLGTRAGLNRLDRDSEAFTQYWVRDGLPHNAVVGMLEDEAGYLWLSTGAGLSRFNPRTETFRNYDARDGLQGNTFWRNAYHQNLDGEMFFGGESGLNAFEPQKITDNPHVPPIVISTFSLFNQAVRTNLRPNEQIDLMHKENFLSFDFAALDYNSPEKNHYAYRLEGVDEDWVYAGTRRHADYSNLGPGDYVFRVKGSNNDGVWNEEGALVRVTIQPPFWATWWFRILVGLVLAGAAFGAVRLRVRNVEARSRELERQVEIEIDQRMKVEEALRQSEMEKAVTAERSRLARELHDAVTQTLFSASLIAEILPRLWAKDPERGRQQLEEVRLLTRGALAEMRSLLLELRPEALARAKMDDLLRQLGRAMTGRTGVPVSVSADVRCSLPAEVQVALYRIAQEALNNTAKHAEASQVEVSFQCEADRATLAVGDDGRGFDVDNISPGHLGVGFMRERAAAVGAELEIGSKIGSGTEIRVHWEQGVHDD
jgi:signal transduction histidine kinase/ligand-binding sensor domain-containing protein